MNSNGNWFLIKQIVPIGESTADNLGLDFGDAIGVGLYFSFLLYEKKNTFQLIFNLKMSDISGQDVEIIGAYL